MLTNPPKVDLVSQLDRLPYLSQGYASLCPFLGWWKRVKTWTLDSKVESWPGIKLGHNLNHHLAPSFVVIYFHLAILRWLRDPFKGCFLHLHFWSRGMCILEVTGGVWCLHPQPSKVSFFKTLLGDPSFIINIMMKIPNRRRELLFFLSPPTQNRIVTPKQLCWPYRFVHPSIPLVRTHWYLEDHPD